MKYLFLCSLVIHCLTLSAQSNLALDQAEKIVQLPLNCVQREFPNKLGQVLNDTTELLAPSVLHPAFYGCFDWHSAVHGQWLMVRLLKDFPNLNQAQQVKLVLSQQLTASNIEREIAFFKSTNNQSFERTYGWAWILKLQQELETWNDTMAKTLATNLLPLSQLLCTNYQLFLPKLCYPIRSGEHTNTAFGLAFAYDYAIHSKNDTLRHVIEQRARAFYLLDKNCNLAYEPSGYDFLSPAFEEIDLMRRILPTKEFTHWLKRFIPELYDHDFQLTPGKVGDRSDGKLVHLDGLNFSRAWCLNALSKLPHLSHLKPIAFNHLNASLPAIHDGDYMGEHWLASFAILALSSFE